jgi:hypothetical protein
LNEITEEVENKKILYTKNTMKTKERSYDSPSTTNDSVKIRIEYFSKSSKKSTITKTIFENENTSPKSTFKLPIIQNRKISDNTIEINLRQRVDNVFHSIDDLKKIINKRNTKIKINSTECSKLLSPNNFQNKYPIKLFKK